MARAPFASREHMVRFIKKNLTDYDKRVWDAIDRLLARHARNGFADAFTDDFLSEIIGAGIADEKFTRKINAKNRAFYAAKQKEPA